MRFDGWNKEREAYSSTYAENQGYGGPSRAYGLQDLNYYGNFFYAGGYGYAWQPYGFANAMLGWDPYSNGAWMFYPGIGYSWASAYPWGWLPFHYGSWAFINGAGWAWLPGSNYGGQWYATSFQSVPRVTRAPAGWTAATPPAVTAATNLAQPTVLVGKAGAKPLSIPGGRIPPNFASLVSGRTAGSATTAQSFAKPNAGNATAHGNVFAANDNSLSAAHHGSSAHVFAPPPVRSVGVGGSEPGIAYGGARTGGSLIGHPSTSGTAASAAHASSGPPSK